MAEEQIYRLTPWGEALLTFKGSSTEYTGKFEDFRVAQSKIDPQQFLVFHEPTELQWRFTLTDQWMILRYPQSSVVDKSWKAMHVSTFYNACEAMDRGEHHHLADLIDEYEDTLELVVKGLNLSLQWNEDRFLLMQEAVVEVP